MTDTTVKPIMVIEGLADEASPMAMPHGEVVYFSTRSPLKETPNEDALGVIPVANDATVLVVADGMGGMPAGEQAARIIVETMTDTLAQKPEEQLLRDAIISGIDQSSQNIKDLRNGAGATVSVVEISGNKLRSYHAGDSLILLTSSHGNIKYLTMAHSPIGYALECGAIEQVTAMLHDERNMISNYVGMPEMFIHVGPVIEMAPQDTVIVASDALSDNLYEQEISEFIRKGSLLDSVNDMIEVCSDNMMNIMPDRRCHPDDFSFICFRVNN